MSSFLTDLDELVLKCRDDKAKSYIQEAVICYKSGAFRSAIISTWIAVSYDIIDKLKDLTLSGDKAAEKQLEDFEKARRQNDITRSLQLERELLINARDKLELISHLEFIDLERLQQDRHRCAHPSMTTDGELFNPSAELARLHIRSAVDHLLQHPAAQGKYALDVLLSEVDSEYFPTQEDKVLNAFRKSPLLKARESLVRNFIIVLLKKLVEDGDVYKDRIKISVALNSIRKMHQKIYETVMQAKFSGLIRTLSDQEFHRTLFFVEKLSGCWTYLEEDVRTKITIYVEKLPADQFDELDFLIDHPGLKSAAERRIRLITRSELQIFRSWYLPVALEERIIYLYTASSSYREANDFASTIIYYAGDLKKNQIEKLIRESIQNPQVIDSRKFSEVIKELRKHRENKQLVIDSLLVEVGLQKYVEHQPEELDF